MDSQERVDVRGLSCPQPALMARQALGRIAQGRVEILVDTGTARDNVVRVAERGGWHVQEEARDGDDVRLVVHR